MCPARHRVCEGGALVAGGECVWHLNRLSVQNQSRSTVQYTPVPSVMFFLQGFLVLHGVCNHRVSQPAHAGFAPLASSQC